MPPLKRVLGVLRLVLGGLALGLVALLLLPGLQELAQDHVALERGDVVDEQDAIEMVDLVLHAGRQQTVAGQLLRLPSRSRNRTVTLAGRTTSE